MLDKPEDQAVEALLAMSEEDLLALPPDVQEQAKELIDAHREMARRSEEERRSRLVTLGQRIVGTYYERAARRQPLEERWLKDIRRYNGEYDPDIAKVLQGREFGSRAFVPLTRRVVDIVEARLVDLLFPTGDRQFALSPSPVPELARAQGLADRLPPEQQVPLGPGGQPIPASSVSLAIRELREEARARCDGMQREVDDQLKEAKYHAQARRVLHEGLVMGTGVIKGPTPVVRTKRAYVDGQLQILEEIVPTVTHVSTWNYFPDMSATEVAQSESDIERHYMTRAQFARLADQPGFETSANEIRRILNTEPGQRRDPRLDELRTAAGLQGVPDPRYLVLEYHGPLERQELIDAGADVPDDNLLVHEGIVWVYEGDGSVLKACVEPMREEQRPYRVYCWRKDPGSIFGFGLSYEVSDIQETANSTFRAGLDNVGLSVGGMLAVNDKVVRPENGRWTIEPLKVYRGTKETADMRAAFNFVEIPNNLQPILQLFDRSKQLLDDIGGPAMAFQGQDAPSYLDTARGASIAYNAANIWFRRGVAHWDDDITTPLVGAFVDWNMEFSPKDEIKGDWNIQARGRDALLEAEGRAQKLIFFQQAAKEVPMPFATRIAQLKEIARSLRIDPDEVLPDEATVKKIGEKVDNAPPPLDPAIERVKLRQAEIADSQAQRAHDREMESMRAQVNLANIASREQLSIEDARQKYGLAWAKTEAELADRRESREHEAQMLNAELAVKVAKGSGV